MDINELNDKLKEFKAEEFVWIIYIGIIALLDKLYTDLL